MEARFKYQLPNGERTWNMSLLCQAFQESEDRDWQLRTLYLHPLEIGKGCSHLERIVNSLSKAGLFDLRDFLDHLLSNFPDLTVFADSSLFAAFSKLILMEIGSRKVILEPKPVNRAWKSNSIIIPSLIDPDKYYWLERVSTLVHTTRHRGRQYSFPLTLIKEGYSKEKIK